MSPTLKDAKDWPKSIIIRLFSLKVIVKIQNGNNIHCSEKYEVVHKCKNLIMVAMHVGVAKGGLQFVWEKYDN